MVQTLANEAAEIYGSFISAFTFTLAVTTVDKMVKSSARNLIVIALTMFVIVTILSFAIVGVKRFVAAVDGKTSSGRLVLGPAALVLFLVSTGRGIAVHFMSTLIGRWVLSLADNNTETTLISLMPTITIGMSLVWLLGKAVGAT